MHSVVNTSQGDSIVLPMVELVGQSGELEEQMEKTTHHNFVAVLKEIPDVYGNIPLHYACRSLQNDNMISLFLSFPQLFNHETHDKKKPIDIAIEYNDPDVIKHFFDLGHIRYVENTKDILTLDEVSTYSPEYEVLSFLKQQYEEVTNGDHSLLSCACRQLHGHKMISHLINPNSIMYRDKKTGLSPLMVAVQHRQLQCIKELLNNKYFTQEAFELVSNISFRTVLHICTKVHNKEITKSLIDSRFMSTTLAVATDVLGDTPLHTCAQVGNAYMTQLLLDYITNHNSPVTTCSDSLNLLTMIKRDTERRMPPESSAIRCINATSRYGSTSRHAHAILTKKNKSKLTPLHVAIQAGNLDVINEMLKYADSSVVNVFDDQKRTSLHMAAAKGHVGIINALLDHWADSHVCDMNEWTPLHHATRCSRNADDEERPQCIENLIKRGLININALTIRRETPLHIACEYGSSKLVKQLIEFDCDLFARNVDDYNCFEVAIEANNEEVVRYLIENDNCFDLMRNSQIRKNKRYWYSLLARHCEVDTPMRKLIRKMPNMALLVLDKCSMRVGIKGTNVKKNIFVYEFLEDQLTVNQWNGGLAVGEIPPLMKQASDNLNRLFFELVVVCEIFRYRIIWILRRGNVNDAIAYSYQNLDKKKWYERFEQWLTSRCSVSAHDDNDDDLAVNTDKRLEY
ncbi:unnamed protein product [Rotaria magnacalcarata]